MVETSQKGGIFWSGSSTEGEGMLQWAHHAHSNLQGRRLVGWQQGAGGPQFGKSIHRRSPPPLSEVGCPGAHHLGVVLGEGPCTAVLGCKAN